MKKNNIINDFPNVNMQLELNMTQGASIWSTV